MKRLLLITAGITGLLAGSASTVHAQELPPQEQRAAWKDLQPLHFTDWEILRFDGWTEHGDDGGSKVFSFKSTTGQKFSIMASSPAYWSPQETRSGKQAFFLIREDRFYHIRHGSAEEKKIISMLRTAAGTLKGKGKGAKDPGLLDILAERLQDRIQMVARGKAY